MVAGRTSELNDSLEGKPRVEDLLPSDWQTVPPDSTRLPEGCCVVICDASFKEGVAGISVSIRVNGNEYDPVEYYAKSKGPVHAELKAIEKALTRLKGLAASRSLHSLIVYSDCKYACNFLESRWTPKRGYIRDTVAAIATCLCELDNGDMEFTLCHTRTKHIGRCDRRAKRKREVELSKRKERVVERINHVETMIVRGREVIVSEYNGRFYAMPKSNGFPPGCIVNLSPVSCSCSWWKNHWGNKDLTVINARALPCKHMCALASHLRIDIYEIFEHQIGRLD
jgi:ribonuclease HI